MTNHIKIVETILYVSDQERSCRFYQKIFRREADLHVPGMTEFNLAGNCKIGLMPNKGIAKILGNLTPHPNRGTGIPRCELYLHVDDIELEFDHALKSGATLISPVLDRDWGDRVCYFSSMLKKQVFIACIILFLCLPLIAQKNYEPPQLSSPDSWTMVLLPDPQTYVKFERNQPILELMTAWISENIDHLNIKMVLCTGDLVEQNQMINPDGKAANQPSTRQWESVSRAFARLDGKVPYITATGNHDYGFKNIENRKSNFNRYFPVDKNPLNQKLLAEMTLNAEGIATLENAVFKFTSPNGKKILFITLEFAPRNNIMDWAKRIVNSEKYKDHTVVLLTHSYLNAKDEHIAHENYPIKDGNYGKAVFDKLVKPSKNIQMVFSGHIGRPDNFRGHVGFRSDSNAGGQKVQQMVFNAQALGGGWMGNGGDGWLRILEFMPDGHTVKVKTFSPFFAISPTTQKHAWHRADYNEFSFTID